MTLGVVDEFRRLGVAKQLLAELMRIALETESVRFVYLHVVEYN